MDKMLEGKTAVVTGAGGRIGIAICSRLAEEGAAVVCADLTRENAEKAAETIRSAGGCALPCQVDVTRSDEVRRMAETALKEFGSVEILVNNAGLSMRAMFRDLDLSVIKTLMDVNFWGTVYCTKYALPFLLQSKGSVVGVISIAGFAGLPGRTGYASSKYAIRGFLDTLRIEHLYDGLHVMVFAPGFTASNVRNAALTADGSQQGKTPRDEGKMMTAERVAEYLASGLERRKNEMILTPIGKLTVFMHNILPRLTDRLEFSYMAKEPDSPFHRR